MRCLACNTDSVASVLDLGLQPLANCLLKRREDLFSSYPLGLVCCPACGHGQLSHFVSAKELFDHYLYASGGCDSLREYFSWFAAEVGRLLSPGADVLEIACNDGTLLGELKPFGYNLLGVDPAANLVEIARSRGFDVIGDFWPCFQAINGRQFDLIVGMNVLAHTPDPHAFLLGVRSALKPDGICLIQTSQARMLLNGEFDTIYHEHFSFFTPRSMATLAARAGLELRAVKLVQVHGTSFAFILTRTECQRDVTDFLASGPYGVQPPSVAAGIIDQITGSGEQYQGFGAAAQARMARVKEACAAHRGSGHPICFVGAAAKAITFLHAAGIRPDHVYDEAPLKIGRYIPGIDVCIEALADIALVNTPLIVISAWNFRDILTAKLKSLLGSRNSEFLVYFPEVEQYK